MAAVEETRVLIASGWPEALHVLPEDLERLRAHDRWAARRRWAVILGLPLLFVGYAAMGLSELRPHAAAPPAVVASSAPSVLKPRAARLLDDGDLRRRWPRITVHFGNQDTMQLGDYVLPRRDETVP